MGLKSSLTIELRELTTTYSGENSANTDYKSPTCVVQVAPDSCSSDFQSFGKAAAGNLFRHGFDLKKHKFKDLCVSRSGISTVHGLFQRLFFNNNNTLQSERRDTK